MNRLHTITRVLLAGFFTALALLPTAYAQSNAISFQGRLTTPDGTPAPDGTYEITFALYDRETGGTPRWSETQNVSISNGVFGIEFTYGDSGDIPFTGDWTQVNVEGETLSPRTRVTSVPSAFVAQVAQVAQGLGENALQAGENITLERQDDGSLMVSTATLLVPAFHVDGGVGDGIGTLDGNGTQENPLRVADGGITEEKVADSAVTGIKIADGAIVGGEHVLVSRQNDGSVMVSVDSVSVSAGLFSPGWDGVSLTGDGTQENPLRVADGGVTSEKLADGSVTGLKIADGAIVGDENILVSRQTDGSVMLIIGDNLVHIEAQDDLEGDGTQENPLGLADGGVTSEKLADGSVIGAKIADGAIGGSGIITVTRDNGGIIEIAGDIIIERSFEGDGTEENPLDLADGGVTSEKLADGSVTGAKIANGAVTGRKLDDEAVSEEKLDDEAVTEDKIADGAVAAAKLDGGVIEAGDGIEVTRTGRGSFMIAVARSAAFRVNQSLDAENESLLPSVVASLEPMAIYNGNVVLDARGEAVVALPDGFAAHSNDVRYQLTCIGGFAPVYVAEEITANRFSIAGGTPGMKVSWQVTGVR